MYSYHRGGLAKGSMLLAVLQTLLLLSALVLVPAAAIAQDPDASPAPAAEATNEPAPDPTPESRLQEPKAEQKPKAQAPKANPKPKADQSKAASTGDESKPEPAQPTLSEQGLTIRIFPQKVDLALGGKAVVSAWLCPADDKTPFGGQLEGDGKPGTKDDDCERVRVKWSLQDDTTARLSNGVGYKTRVTLLAGTENRLTAKVDDLKRNTKITVKAEPAKVRPEADKVLAEIRNNASQEQDNSSSSQQQEQQPPQVDPTTEPPKAEPSEEPVVESSADPVLEPKAEPSEEPADEAEAEATEPPADEPSAESSEAPADEPSAEPSEEPVVEPSTDPVVEPSEAPADEPSAEPSEAPADEPSAEPTEVPTEVETSQGAASRVSAAANGTLTIRKGGDRTGPGNGGVSGLAGATFKVYSNASLSTEVGSCVTNASGQCSVSLAPGNNYYVREEGAPSGFQVIDYLGTGSGTDNGTQRAYAGTGVGPFQLGSGGTITAPSTAADSSLNDNTGRYLNRRVNPTLPAVCGLKMALLFDLSGSIDNTEFNQMKNAAKSFVNGLSGTPSQVGVYSFATDAPAAGNANHGAVSIAGGTGTVNGWIDGLVKPGSNSYYTNWDEALASIPAGYDLVIILTDGNPTVDSETNSNAQTSFQRVENGIASANGLKTKVGLNGGHTRVIGIGIGIGGASIHNLAAIAGPVAFNGSNGDTADYFLSNFDQLGEVLAEIASALCGGTVTVHKEVRDGANGSWSNGADWTFDAKRNGNSLGAQQTDAQGLTNFDFDNSGNVTAQIVESVKDGYSIKDITCTRNGQAMDPTSITNGVQFQLGPKDSVSCNFRNERDQARLTLVKSITNDDGGTVTDPDAFGLTIGGQPALSGVAMELSPGKYAINETLVEGYEFVKITGKHCPKHLGDKVQLASGDDITCTIHNDDIAPSLQLVKVVDGGDTGADNWTLTATAAAPNSGRNISNPGGSHVATDVYANVEYTLGEAGPDGYSQSAWSCTAGELEGNVLTLGLDEDAVCTIVNSLAQLSVKKTASPDTYSAVGQEIVYTITATNTGAAALTNVDITDELIDGLASWTCRVGDTVVTLPVAELPSGQAITCQATYVIAAADVAGSDPAGFVDNTACATSDETPAVCDSVQVNEIVIELDKSVTPTVMAEPGGIFTYTLVIDNDSVVPVTITALTDDNSGLSPDWAANCAVLVGIVLAPDGPGEDDEVECTYTVQRTVAGEYFNRAVVTGTDANGRVAKAKDHVKVKVLKSRLAITKTADVDYFTAAGDEIVYTITATNTGQSTLTNVDISDALIDELDDWNCDPGNPVASLAAGASIVCTATYTVTEADVEAGEVLNTACVDSDQVGPECDDVDVPLAALEIVKTADTSVFGAVGDEILYTITATNVGQANLTNVDISDALIDGLGSWSCVPGNPVATLAPGDAIVCQATYVITEADFEAGSVLNTACADSDETGRVCDDVVIEGIDVTIEKTPNKEVVNSGERVTFTLVFSHSTPTDVSTITAFSLVDDVFGDLFDAGNNAVTANTCVDYAGQVLLPDTDYECSFKAKLVGTPKAPHVNVVKIVVEGDGREAESSDDATVGFVAVSSVPTPRPTESLKPTDMLLTTDSIGPVDDGNVLGGLLSWTVWLALSVLLILSTAWIIRRERLAEEHSR